jgi:hypothetical protein
VEKDSALKQQKNCPVTVLIRGIDEGGFLFIPFAKRS